MKYMLISLLLALSAFCYGQNIPEGANAIVVENLSFDSLVAGITKIGLQLDPLDRVNHTLRTSPRRVSPNSLYIIVINAKQESNQTVFSGNCYILYKEDTALPVAYNGKGGGIFMQSFVKLNYVAASFGKPIEYEVIK